MFLRVQVTKQFGKLIQYSSTHYIPEILVAVFLLLKIWGTLVI